MDGQTPQPVGLGVFEAGDADGQLAAMGVTEDIMGGSKSSEAGKKKKSDDDDANYTTIMLRNIPNKYTRQMLIDQFHRAGFRGDIDYMYLPVDFANRCNVGYCFINFRDSPTRVRFVASFGGVAAQACLPGFNSYKVCQVTRAKWQGRQDNVRRLKSSPELMAQLATHTEWLPLLLDEEGNQEAFVCDDVVGLGRSSTSRRGRKKQQGMVDMYPGMMTGMEDWMMMGGMADMNGLFGGKKGGRGKGQNNTSSGMYYDMSQGGVPAMMSVPIMTEQGLQYIPYDGSESGYVMYSPGADMYGMMGGAYGAGAFSPYPGMWDDGFAAGMLASRQDKAKGAKSSSRKLSGASDKAPAD